MGNVLKTGFLLAVLTCLVILVGQALGGQQGMLIAFVLALGMNFFSYWFSDKMVLAMYRAQPVDEAAAPELFGMVRTLATRAGIPMPKVYVIPSDTPNAFATGRNPEHAAVAVTEGIMRILSHQELEGVVARAGPRRTATLIMTITATLAGHLPGSDGPVRGDLRGRRERRRGTVAASGDLPRHPGIAAMLVRLAISARASSMPTRPARRLPGAHETGLALEKLDRVQIVPCRPPAAHLFIVNPLSAGMLRGLLTHPSTEERVARLRAMALSR
jgi:heat shock protein HtpX